MFVKNKEKIDFNYRKNGYLAVLKAGAVSYVDENKVTAKELVACYGQRIDIISRTEDAKRPTDVKPKPKAVETIKKEDLNDSFITKILEEIEGETEDSTDLNKEISNLVSKDIKDFLNGKTDVLPEGTIEISEKEATKLEAQQNKSEGKAAKAPENKATKAPKGNKVAKVKQELEEQELKRHNR